MPNERTEPFFWGFAVEQITTETIGKYRLIERLGPGGPGAMWKAHDPILDRLVALRVISTGADVTDRLRARFFGEAQASARLSHPNIVTLYDMGEHEGRLFIAMEYVQGEKMNRFLERREEMALEDKLSVMLQVCDGVHYAHEMGIVHRSLKPGSIMLLGDGKVKLLDFGIAQIEAAEVDLTRTSLGDGILAYMSPEHFEGRADRRSDIFSVGIVFYEFLSFRLPFSRAQIGQVPGASWAEIPQPLDQPDRAVPPELAGAIARAMRLEPAERWDDLNQMRSELERIRRALLDEAAEVRTRVTGDLNRLREIEAALARALGTPAEGGASVQEPRGSLAAMLRLEETLPERIESAERSLAKAERLGPSVQLAADMLDKGLRADAIVELEAIVGEMPDHGGALALLARARDEVDRERQSLLFGTLLREARAAHDQRDHALCLDMLDQTADIPLPPDATGQIEALRTLAQQALTTEQTAHRSRAEAAREQMSRARNGAEPFARKGYSRDRWDEAETTSATADTALGRSAYSEAERGFAAAAAMYRRLSDLAGQAQRADREAASRARDEVVKERVAPRPKESPGPPGTTWNLAETRYEAAEAAFAEGEARESATLYADALALYRQAAQEAAEASERARRSAEESGERADAAERAAASAAAPSLAPLSWSRASAASADARSDLAAQRYAVATERFDAAGDLFRRAEREARQLRADQRDGSERARRAAAERRDLADTRGARLRADNEFREAEANLVAGDKAHAREVYPDAIRAFEQADAWFRLSEARAAEIERVHQERGAASSEPVSAPPDARVRGDVIGRAEQSTVTPTQPAAEPEPTPNGEAGPNRAWLRQWSHAAVSDESEVAGSAAVADTAGSARMPRGTRFPLISDDERPSVRESEPDGVQRRKAPRWRFWSATGALALCAVVALVALLYRPGTPPGPEPPPASTGPPSPETKAKASALEWAGRSNTAREAALAARANTKVPGLFNNAVKTERDGQTALDRGDWAASEQRHREAVDAYTRSKLEAERPMLPPRGPGPATAPKLDPTPMRERPSESSVGPTTPPALPTRRASSAEPPKTVPAKTRRDAQQARDGMDKAKRGAEKVAAAFFASQAFDAAQAKERDGLQALEQSDFEAAMRLFTEAHAGYVTAGEDAKAESIKEKDRGPMRTKMEQARAMALERRAEALKVAADRRAPDLLERAQVKHGEADALANRQAFEAAAQAYQDAADRYRQAVLRTGVP